MVYVSNLIIFFLTNCKVKQKIEIKIFSFSFVRLPTSLYGIYLPLKSLPKQLHSVNMKNDYNLMCTVFSLIHVFSWIVFDKLFFKVVQAGTNFYTKMNTMYVCMCWFAYGS